MKKFNKMLVVLPLVLVFVLSSLPVFAWNAGTGNLTITSIELKKDGATVTAGPVTIPFSEFDEATYAVGVAKKAIEDKVMARIFKGTIFEADFAAKKLQYKDPSQVTAILGHVETATANQTVNKLELEEVKPAEDPKPTEPKSDLKRCIAIDKLSGDIVWTEMAQISNKNGAASWHDMANEFYQWELTRGNKLKDYYLVGHAPDINNTVSDAEQKLRDELNVDLIIWVVEKIQDLLVTHVFPDRSPLTEKIGVDYYVLINNQINNYNAAEFAKTRVQKMNELGYVFEKAEYVPYSERSGLLKEARDAYGRELPVNLFLKGNGIFVYYKGAPIPAPVVDSQKKVDAASAQTPAQTGVVNTNVQANVQAPAAPVTAAGQQLPATGVADNAFLFLSSAALMALGIFFFKKH